MIAGDRAVLTMHDVDRTFGEGIPMRRACAAKGRSFDLIGGGCGPEQKTCGEIRTGLFHGGSFKLTQSVALVAPNEKTMCVSTVVFAKVRC